MIEEENINEEEQQSYLSQRSLKSLASKSNNSHNSHLVLKKGQKAGITKKFTFNNKIDLKLCGNSSDRESTGKHIQQKLFKKGLTINNSAKNNTEAFSNFYPVQSNSDSIGKPKHSLNEPESSNTLASISKKQVLFEKQQTLTLKRFDSMISEMKKAIEVS